MKTICSKSHGPSINDVSREGEGVYQNSDRKKGGCVAVILTRHRSSKVHIGQILSNRGNLTTYVVSIYDDIIIYLLVQ